LFHKGKYDYFIRKILFNKIFILLSLFFSCSPFWIHDHLNLVSHAVSHPLIFVLNLGQTVRALGAHRRSNRSHQEGVDDWTQYHYIFHLYLICLLFLSKMVVRDGEHKAESCRPYMEGASDVPAVEEAMLKLSEKQGAPVQEILSYLK
jgi:hypothetical protein